MRAVHPNPKQRSHLASTVITPDSAWPRRRCTPGSPSGLAKPPIPPTELYKPLRRPIGFEAQVRARDRSAVQRRHSTHGSQRMETLVNDHRVGFGLVYSKPARDSPASSRPFPAEADSQACDSVPERTPRPTDIGRARELGRGQITHTSLCMYGNYCLYVGTLPSNLPGSAVALPVRVGDANAPLVNRTSERPVGWKRSPGERGQGKDRDLVDSGLNLASNCISPLPTRPRAHLPPRSIFPRWCLHSAWCQPDACFGPRDTARRTCDVSIPSPPCPVDSVMAG